MLPSSNKTIIEGWIRSVKDETWKDDLHLGRQCLSKEDRISLTSVLTISNFHAVCVACQHQIFSRSDATDISSMFMDHVNSQQHVILLRSLPTNKPVFKPVPTRLESNQKLFQLWKCNACSESLEPTPFQSYKSLESMIADHSSTPDHELNVHLILQPIASRLIGIAMTPPFMDLVTDLECRLCNLSVPGPFHREQHVKTTLHLDYVEHVLATEHGLTIDQISQDDKLFQLFEKLCQGENHSETLVEPEQDKILQSKHLDMKSLLKAFSSPTTVNFLIELSAQDVVGRIVTFKGKQRCDICGQKKPLTERHLRTGDHLKRLTMLAVTEIGVNLLHDNAPSHMTAIAQRWQHYYSQLISGCKKIPSMAVPSRTAFLTLKNRPLYLTDDVLDSANSLIIPEQQPPTNTTKLQVMTGLSPANVISKECESAPPHSVTQANENDPKPVTSRKTTSREPEVARVVPAEPEQEAPVRKETEVLSTKYSNEFATSCDVPVRTTFSLLSSQDQLLVERSVEFVAIEEWIIHYPHPDAMLHRKNSYLDGFFSAEHKGLSCAEIDIVNEIHAFCVHCQEHIYTRSDQDDVSSQHIDHINGHAHRYHLKTLPTTSKIFTKSEKSWKCNACNEVVKPVMKAQEKKLLEEMEDHVKTDEHMSKQEIYDDTTECRLIGIAMSPIMKNKATGLCSLCHTQVNAVCDIDEHVVSDRHLDALEDLLSIIDIHDDEQLKDFFAKQINQRFLVASPGNVKGSEKSDYTISGSGSTSSMLTSAVETLVTCSVQFVAKNEWKEMQKPHPSSVVARAGRKRTGVHCADKTIDVINHYHAYCIACQIHIYSRSDNKDIASLHITHVNSPAHRCHVQKYPKTDPIFEKYGRQSYCIACPRKKRGNYMAYKSKSKSLQQEIDEHMASDVHQDSAELMNDPRESRLVGIGLSPIMKKQMRNPCGICHTKCPKKYGMDTHIKSPEHLNALEDMLEDVDFFDDEKLAEFFTGQVLRQAGVEVDSSESTALLNHLTTDTSNQPVEATSLSNVVKDSNPTVFSSLSNKLSVKRSMKFVETDGWKKWQEPHPDSVTQRSQDVIRFPDATIDVFNDYHAYCVACHLHIYSRSDPDDESSLHIPHIVGHAHRFHIGKLPKTGKIFEVTGGSSYCNACQKTVPPLTKNAKRTLKEEIESHVCTEPHEWNAALLTLETHSRLVAIGMSPIMKINVSNPCPLCHASFSNKYGNEAHIKSPEHLNALEDLLKGIDIFDSEQIKEFFEKQLQPINGKENVCLELTSAENPVQPATTEVASTRPELDPSTNYAAEGVVGPKPAALVNHKTSDTPNEPVLEGTSLRNFATDSERIAFACLPEKQQIRVQCAVEFVEKNEWKKWHQPHSDSVKERSSDVIQFHDPNINVVNDYHAYCVACELHIYSRSDSADVSSLHTPHIASKAHRFQMRGLPKTSRIFEVNGDSAYCNACQKTVAPITQSAKKTLKEKMEKHVAKRGHEWNAELMTHEKNCRLVGMALSPIMKTEVTSPCPFCHAIFSDKYGNEAHIKSCDHLWALADLLQGVDISDSDEIREFFAKQSLKEDIPKEEVTHKGSESTEVNDCQYRTLSKPSARPSEPATSTDKVAADITLPGPSPGTVAVSKTPLSGSSFNLLYHKKKKKKRTRTRRRRNIKVTEDISEMPGNSTACVAGSKLPDSGTSPVDVSMIPLPGTSTVKIAADISKTTLPGTSTGNVAASKLPESGTFPVDVSMIPLPGTSTHVNEAVTATNVTVETSKADDKSCDEERPSSKVNEEVGKSEGNSVIRNLKACVSLAKYLRATPFFIHPYLQMTKAVDNRKGQEAEVVIPSSELPEEVEVSCRTSGVVKEAIASQKREENTVEEEEVALPSSQEAVDALLPSEEAEDACFGTLDALEAVEEGQQIAVNGAEVVQPWNELPERENWDVTLEVAAELGGECSAASGDYEQSSGSIKGSHDEIGRLPSLSQGGAILHPSSNDAVDSSHAQPRDHQHSKTAEQPSGYVTRVMRPPRITHPPSSLWKELYRPHPWEVTSREPVAVKRTTRLRWIDVINGFHAYCLPCRRHIYARSDPFDVCSYFHAHLNTAQHRLHVQLLAPARPVFQHDPSDTLGPDTWLCNACGHFLLPQEQDPATPLRLLVGTHLDSLEHEETARLMDDPVLSLLVAAACTPMLMAEIRLDVCRKHCRLCNSYFWDTVTTDQHIKTLPHLSNVRRVLETGFKLNVDEIVNSNQSVRDVLKLLTFFPQ